MAITDYWGNVLDSDTGTAIGYRGEFEEFPHELYSFLLSTVREADQNEIALLYRWMIPMQQHWESQYSNILALPNLYSPELCPEPLLDYLRKNIGIMDDLAYLWGVLTENERRRLIKYFVRFCQLRSSTYGIVEMIEAMTGRDVFVFGYFYYRWLLSGDATYEMEGAIGREDDESDIWLISEEDMPVGVIPTDVSTQTNPTSGDDYYLIQVDNLVAAVTNPPVPNRCNVRCLLTNTSTFGIIYESGGSYYVRLVDDYFFGQPDTSPSTERLDFRVSFEPDPYVYDIFVVDDGNLNRAMVRALAKFSRPASERIYIRYYKMIENFTTDDNWSVLTGEAVHDSDNNIVTIGNSGTPPGAISVYDLDYEDSDNWQDYVFVVKAKTDTNDLYIEFRFMYQGANDYYYFRSTPNTPPSWPPYSWELGRYVSGAPTVLDTGSGEWLDVDVDYMWRIVCRTSTRPGGDVQQIRVYQDEVELIEYIDDPLPWTSAYGTIQLVAEDGTELTVTTVRVRGLPGENDYVGP